MRIRLPKLAASAVAPLVSIPKMDSGLFKDRSITWPQDVNYLRDTYSSIKELWDLSSDNQLADDDEQLYKATEPKVKELTGGLKDVIAQMPQRSDLTQELQLANSNNANAEMHANTGNWAMATTFQANSLVKIRSMLDTLTRMAGKNIRQYAAFNLFTSRLTKKAKIDSIPECKICGLKTHFVTDATWKGPENVDICFGCANNIEQGIPNERVVPKKAYGYNQEGVIEEPGARNPQHDSGEGNTRNPGLDVHPENSMVDEKALKDFPELAITYNHRPTRTF